MNFLSNVCEYIRNATNAKKLIIKVPMKATVKVPEKTQYMKIHMKKKKKLSKKLYEINGNEKNGKKRITMSYTFTGNF